MFTVETGQSEKADAETSVAETIRVMAHRHRSSQLSGRRSTSRDRNDQGDIDSTGARTAMVRRVNGDLYIKGLGQEPYVSIQ